MCNKLRTKLQQFVSYGSARWCCWLEEGRQPHHFSRRLHYSLGLCMLRLFIPAHVRLRTSNRLDVLSRTWAGIKSRNNVVTHPVAASYAPVTSKKAGSAATFAETRKHQAFERFNDSACYEFVSLAVGSFDWLGKEAACFLNNLGDVAAADGCMCKATFVRIARQELRCALCRGNARIYDCKKNRLHVVLVGVSCPGCKGSGWGWRRLV